MMALGNMKSAKQTRLFHIFVSPGPRHGQVKNWYGASGLFSISALCSCTRRYGANWLLSIYFQPWDWGVPGNVLAEHMGFIKTSCRVSWLFIFLSFRNLTPLIRLNIWNINLFWVSQLTSIVTQDTVLQLAEVQHQICCYLQFWIW